MYNLIETQYIFYFLSTYNNQEVIFICRWTEMFYGTRKESSEGERPGVEGSISSTPASVDFPEVKKKVCVIINSYIVSL